MVAFYLFFLACSVGQNSDYISKTHKKGFYANKSQPFNTYDIIWVFFSASFLWNVWIKTLAYWGNHTHFIERNAFATGKLNIEIWFARTGPNCVHDFKMWNFFILKIVFGNNVNTFYLHFISTFINKKRLIQTEGFLVCKRHGWNIKAKNLIDVTHWNVHEHHENLVYLILEVLSLRTHKNLLEKNTDISFWEQLSRD